MVLAALLLITSKHVILMSIGINAIKFSVDSAMNSFVIVQYRPPLLKTIMSDGHAILRWKTTVHKLFWLVDYVANGNIVNYTFLESLNFHKID